MRHVTRFLLVWAAVCAMVGAPATAGAQSPPRYDAFYTFGDSLGDTGNALIVTKLLRMAPAVPPSESPHKTYFEGRFSNGPVAFEYLWWMLQEQPSGSPNGLRPFLATRQVRTGAVNFAFGGSESGLFNRTPGGFLVPGLRGQVELFEFALRGRRPPRRALYAIVTGANDYLTMPPALPADPTRVVANISDAIRTLYRRGARDIMVLNLPDLGSLPIVAGTPESALLTGLSHVHNALLAQSLASLAADLRGINLIPVDLAAVAALLPPDTNVVIPALDTLFAPPLPGQPPVSLCLFIDARTCPDAPTFAVAPQFFYWDVVHPTTAIHNALAQYLYGSLLP